MNKVLITGAAGFIGSNLAKRLLSDNYEVIGIDNLSDYYDVSLKEDRLKEIDNNNFIFIKEDINNENNIRDIFNKYKPDIVVHLAACTGIRYSIEEPDIYIKTNIDGFYNILKISKEFNIKHFMFSSSSSMIKLELLYLSSLLLSLSDLFSISSDWGLKIISSMGMLFSW